METDSPVLEAEGVESGYGDLQVLFGVDATVHEDEIVLVFGPNGSGKSTFMKSVFGLLPLWDGSVRLRGTDVSGVPAEAMTGKGVAYVPQVENVFPNLTVAENLEIGGVDADDPAARRAEIFEVIPQVEGLLGQRAGTLSGGQRQLVAMARALMNEPSVLLLDEPSAGLAPNLVDEVFEYVERINEAGTAILMIEQNVEAGLAVADRGYALEGGENRFTGPADELFHDDEIRELYLGH